MEIKRSPFGWYKAFKLSCKGHPLSELAREIRLEPGKKLKDDEKVTREDVVKDISSEYLLLTPKGEEIKIDLEYLDDYEVFEDRGHFIDESFPEIIEDIKSID